jgi:hypothetical protein
VRVAESLGVREYSQPVQSPPYNNEKETDVAERITYRNTGGMYVDLAGQRIPHGIVFESDDPGLCEKFPNKFELVQAKQAPKPEPTAIQELAAAVQESKSVASQAVPPGPESKPTIDMKADVTVDFPTAVENDLSVVTDKHGWWVLDHGELINDKPLAKKEVAKVIKTYLGD